MDAVPEAADLAGGRGLPGLAAEDRRRICSGLVSPLWRRVEALQEEHWAAQPEDVELRLDLANAIEALPETYREALSLFYYCDLSVAETAGRLGITNSAARVRLHRGRELIRLQLTRERGPAPDPIEGCDLEESGNGYPGNPDRRPASMRRPPCRAC